MTHYIPQGNSFDVTANANITVLDELPIGTYAVKLDMKRGYYLDRIASFTSPKGKVYGHTPRHAERIWSTFEQRPHQTGVLLSGEAGSGKTMLAKELSLMGLAKGVSTLVINQALYGEDFNTFIASIDQPLVVIFDEFEKVYDRDDQEKMLTLLDGLYASKRLFILTCNDKYRINTHMLNRPGRLFYHLEYTGLDQTFIEEYCNDNLEDTTHTPVIMSIAAVFPKFNFDMLKAIVEEVNRYGDTPHQALEMLNAKPNTEHAQTFQVRVTDKDGKTLDTDKTWTGAPLDSQGIELYLNTEEQVIKVRQEVTAEYERHIKSGVYTEVQVERHIERALRDLKYTADSDDNPELFAQFTIRDFQRADAKTGDFIFENEQGQTLTLSKKIEQSFSWA